MAQARLKGSGIISYDNSDFDSATQANYIVKNKTAADAEGEPIKGSFEFTGTAASGQVANGKTFYNNGSVYSIKTGGLTFQSASATKESNVEKGQLFYNSSNVYTPATGTLNFAGTAKASDVLSGNTFHGDALHKVSTGSVAILTDSSKNTTTAMVEKDKIFYGGSLSSQKGTLTFSGSAVPSNVVSGKTFYNTDLHTIRTGQLNWALSTTSGTATDAAVESGKTYYNTKTLAQFATPSASLRTGTLNFNSASATKESDVENGYVVYTGLHTRITGSMTLKGTAAASDVISGKTFQSGIRTVSTGSLVLSGNAATSDVKKGKTYWIAPGVSGTGTLELIGTAGQANVLSGKTFYNTSYTATSGTMVDRGDVKIALNTGQSYTIPAGYHRGAGKVSQNTVATQTAIAASASPAIKANIWSGKTAWVNGVHVTGSGWVANTTAVDGRNSKTGNAWEDNKVTIAWTFPTYSFFTGVCILRQGGSKAPSSTNPSADSNKVYMGAGTKKSNGSHYWVDNLGQGTSGYVSYSIYPYVVINGTNYFYGEPTCRTITGIRLYNECGCFSKDCDGGCDCDSGYCVSCTTDCGRDCTII